MVKEVEAQLRSPWVDVGMFKNMDSTDKLNPILDSISQR